MVERLHFNLEVDGSSVTLVNLSLFNLNSLKIYPLSFPSSLYLFSMIRRLVGGGGVWEIGMIVNLKTSTKKKLKESHRTNLILCVVF